MVNSGPMNDCIECITIQRLTFKTLTEHRGNGQHMGAATWRDW